MDKTEEILSFLNKSDRYKVLDALGEGVAARVEGVFDTYLRRVVARKQLNREHLENPDIVQTFLNEMVMVASLNHPGILPVYDALLSRDGDPSYIMALAEGQSLHQVMEMDPASGDCKVIPLGQAVRILTKIAETLTYVHDRGVLHLDIKPENVVLGQYGEVTMMDWGAALVYDKDKYTQTYKAVAGEIKVGGLGVESGDLLMGTPMYMSPEQLQNKRDQLQPTSDIFSVGVLFYQMLTGQLPFRAVTLKDMVHRICNDEYDPVYQVNPDVPLTLSRLCDKMLRKEPQYRLQSCNDIQDAIEDYQRSAAGFPTRSYDMGEVIFREDDPSDYVCIVVSGTVSIRIGGDEQENEIARITANQPFGELAALTGLKRSATAVALEPSVIRVISREEIQSEIDKLSPWVGGIVTALTERVINMNFRVLDLDK